MSHVNDGELHAYLDGALQDMDRERAEDVGTHLRLCVDCRARLEDARQIREQAGAILASVAPPVEMPPFEEIKAAAAARLGDGTDGEERWTATVPTRPVLRRASWALGRMAGLAWAASVAFALAVGWQGRQLWRPSRESQPIALNERLQGPSPAEPEVDANEPLGFEAEPSVTYADDVGEGQESAARSLEPGRGERAEAFKRDAAELSVAGAGADNLAEGRDEAAATETQKTADTRSNDVATLPDAGARAAQERQAQTPEAPRDAPVAAELEVHAEPRPDSDAFLGQVADKSPETWLSVNVDDAEHWLGAAVLSVPDVPVEEVAISARDGTRVVRVRQRLNSGVLVELVEARTPSEARMSESQVLDEVQTDEEARPSDERTDAEVAVRGAVTSPEEADELKNVLSIAFASAWRDGILVTVQAPLAIDSLRSLLSRLR
jgi:hypothetical protein